MRSNNTNPLCLQSTSLMLLRNLPLFLLPDVCFVTHVFRHSRTFISIKYISYFFISISGKLLLPADLCLCSASRCRPRLRQEEEKNKTKKRVNKLRKWLRWIDGGEFINVEPSQSCKDTWVSVWSCQSGCAWTLPENSLAQNCRSLLSPPGSLRSWSEPRRLFSPSRGAVA